MRPAFGVLLFGMVFSVGLASPALPQDARSPADERGAAPTSSSNPEGHVSGKVVVRDVVYWLEEREQRLHLVSQSTSPDDRQVKREELKEFIVPKGAKVDEIAIARMEGKNLLAAV